MADADSRPRSIDTLAPKLKKPLVVLAPLPLIIPLATPSAITMFLIGFRTLSLRSFWYLLKVLPACCISSLAVGPDMADGSTANEYGIPSPMQMFLSKILWNSAKAPLGLLGPSGKIMSSPGSR